MNSYHFNKIISTQKAKLILDDILNGSSDYFRKLQLKEELERLLNLLLIDIEQIGGTMQEVETAIQKAREKEFGLNKTATSKNRTFRGIFLFFALFFVNCAQPQTHKLTIPTPPQNIVEKSKLTTGTIFAKFDFKSDDGSLWHYKTKQKTKINAILELEKKKLNNRDITILVKVIELSPLGFGFDTLTYETIISTLEILSKGMELEFQLFDEEIPEKIVFTGIFHNANNSCFGKLSPIIIHKDTFSQIHSFAKWIDCEK